MCWMAEYFICLPNAERCREIKKGFWDEYLIPNCVGIMDGTHIPIQCPVL